jgi:hypothetical protein
MADEATVAALEASVEAAREVVTTQGDVVRQLKAEVKDGTAERVRRCRSRSPRACRCRRARSPTHPPPRSQSAVDAAIEKLKQLRMELDQKVKVGTLAPIASRREPPPPPPPPPLTDGASQPAGARRRLGRDDLLLARGLPRRGRQRPRAPPLLHPLL